MQVFLKTVLILMAGFSAGFAVAEQEDPAAALAQIESREADFEAIQSKMAEPLERGKFRPQRFLDFAKTAVQVGAESGKTFSADYLMDMYLRKIWNWNRTDPMMVQTNTDNYASLFKEPFRKAMIELPKSLSISLLVDSGYSHVKKLARQNEAEGRLNSDWNEILNGAQISWAIARIAGDSDRGRTAGAALGAAGGVILAFYEHFRLLHAGNPHGLLYGEDRGLWVPMLAMYGGLGGWVLFEPLDRFLFTPRQRAQSRVNLEELVREAQNNRFASLSPEVIKRMKNVVGCEAALGLMGIYQTAIAQMPVQGASVLK